MKSVLMLIWLSGPLFVSSVFAAVAQLGAIYYVFDMNSTTKETYDELGVDQCYAPGSALFLRWICVTVFVASVLMDLKESCSIVSYLSLIPTINKWTDADKEALDDKNSLLTKRVVVAKTNGTQYQIEVICCGGISSLERAWWWLWIVVKVVAELGCMVAGSGYVLYADSNENLILNSVALLFITQIDDIAYSFAVTDYFKGLLDGLPDIGKVECTDPEHKAGDGLVLAQLFGPWLSICLLFGTTSIMWGVNC
ncbi:hypothetical protein TeGR_g9098 [Tetraparma gracilis]|uniref:Uncharacterized protein n=1 Tax=Tetraparma gracilis TaxID=2962635 RepID=A0ABQ6MXX7_9STRA|nr:hypothetical protein TeGR_g9098 [Tetraparma gracilis]